jgi:hypothetical protein
MKGWRNSIGTCRGRNPGGGEDVSKPRLPKPACAPAGLRWAAELAWAVLAVAAPAPRAVPAAGQAALFRWPAVAPARAAMRVTDPDHFVLKLPIFDTTGAQRYLLICAGQDSDDGTKDDFGYVPLFQCRLRSTDSPDTLDYEVFSAGVTWESMGRFAPSDLLHGCRDRPDWGASRSFLLRGMRILVSAGQVQERNGVPSAFNLSVVVTPQAAALGAVPLPPRFEPGRAPCSVKGPRQIPGIPDERYLEANGLIGPFAPVIAASNSIVMHEPSRLTDLGGGRPGRMPIRLLDVRSGANRLAYTLRCGAFTPGVFREPEWAVDCGLFRRGSNVNLLSNAVDPYSRMSEADFLQEQLIGPCSHYPGWGASRLFRLRGMDLKIWVSDARLDPDRDELNTITLHASVTADPAAIAPVALPPAIVYWGVTETREAQQECGTVLVGDEPSAALPLYPGGPAGTARRHTVPTPSAPSARPPRP